MEVFMSRTKVLIVDDEEEFASALAERLQIRQYDASAVFTADEAISVIHNDPPDVVLLDLRMPGMDGLRALKTIKDIHPRIEVIIVTGLATEENRAEALRSGAFNYVTKPIEIDDLIVIIDLAKSNKDQN
jgi:two-component system response regulator CpxR